jgi:hypothetical protein
VRPLEAVPGRAHRSRPPVAPARTPSRSTDRSGKVAGLLAAVEDIEHHGATALVNVKRDQILRDLKGMGVLQRLIARRGSSLRPSRSTRPGALAGSGYVVATPSASSDRSWRRPPETRS